MSRLGVAAAGWMLGMAHLAAAEYNHTPQLPACRSVQTHAHMPPHPKRPAARQTCMPHLAAAECNHTPQLPSLPLRAPSLSCLLHSAAHANPRCLPVSSVQPSSSCLLHSEVPQMCPQLPPSTPQPDMTTSPCHCLPSKAQRSAPLQTTLPNSRFRRVREVVLNNTSWFFIVCVWLGPQRHIRAFKRR